MTRTNSETTTVRELFPRPEIFYDVHTGESHGGEKRILVPTPSNNEDDPLVSKIGSSRCHSDILTFSELELNMEAIVIINQAVFVVHQRPNTALNRTPNTNLHPKIPQDAP